MDAVAGVGGGVEACPLVDDGDGGGAGGFGGDPGGQGGVVVDYALPAGGAGRGVHGEDFSHLVCVSIYM